MARVARQALSFRLREASLPTLVALGHRQGQLPIRDVRGPAGSSAPRLVAGCAPCCGNLRSQEHVGISAGSRSG
jgi:hypothetical protein